MIKVCLIDDTFKTGAEEGERPRANRIKHYLERLDCDVSACQELRQLEDGRIIVEQADAPNSPARASEEQRAHDSLPLCDLYLVHITQDWAAAFAQQVNAADSPHVPLVAYSGGGLSIKKGEPFTSRALELWGGDTLRFDLENPFYFAVYRLTVMRGDESAFRSTLEELCRLVRERPEKALSESSFLSKFHGLFNPSGRDNLTALSVLCQGYLAAHMDARPASTKINEALNRMGLTKGFAGSRLSITMEDIAGAEIKSKVEEPEWWQRVFNSNREDLNNELSKEWGGKLPSDISNLVEAIYLKSTQLKDPAIIASAYLAILEKSKG